MTPQEMIAVIKAHADGKRIEMRRDGETNEWTEITTPVWNFAVWEYRVKPPALRPHWPAVLLTGASRFGVTATLFATEHDAVCDLPGKSVVRLATEYPPVMLP